MFLAYTRAILPIDGESSSGHSHYGTTNPIEKLQQQQQQQLVFNPTGSTESFDDYPNFSGGLDGQDTVFNVLNRGPSFDTTASKNVTALVGKTAYLNCRIRNLGNKTVH